MYVFVLFDNHNQIFIYRNFKTEYFLILLKLNLKKCQNVPIAIQEEKGISGGEKRRLAFASEILTNPSVLFFFSSQNILGSKL